MPFLIFVKIIIIITTLYRLLNNKHSCIDALSYYEFLDILEFLAIIMNMIFRDTCKSNSSCSFENAFRFILVSRKTQNHPLVSWSSSSSSSLVSTCPRPGWTNIGGERLLSTKLSCMEREFRKDIFSSFSEKPGLSPPPRKQDDGA